MLKKVTQFCPEIEVQTIAKTFNGVYNPNNTFNRVYDSYFCSKFKVLTITKIIAFTINQSNILVTIL